MFDAEGYLSRTWPKVEPPKWSITTPVNKDHFQEVIDRVGGREKVTWAKAAKIVAKARTLDEAREEIWKEFDEVS